MKTKTKDSSPILLLNLFIRSIRWVRAWRARVGGEAEDDADGGGEPRARKTLKGLTCRVVGSGGGSQRRRADAHADQAARAE